MLLSSKLPSQFDLRIIPCLKVSEIFFQITEGKDILSARTDMYFRNSLLEFTGRNFCIEFEGSVLFFFKFIFCFLIEQCIWLLLGAYCGLLNLLETVYFSPSLNEKRIFVRGKATNPPAPSGCLYVLLW